MIGDVLVVDVDDLFLLVVVVLERSCTWGAISREMIKKKMKEQEQHQKERDPFLPCCCS